MFVVDEFEERENEEREREFVEGKIRLKWNEDEEEVKGSLYCLLGLVVERLERRERES